MVDDSSPTYEIELFISSELMKESCVEDESQVEALSDKSNNKYEFEEHQNNLSKTIIKSLEELQFNKNQHGLGYDKGNNYHIPDYCNIAIGLLNKKSTIQSISSNQRIWEVLPWNLESSHCSSTIHWDVVQHLIVSKFIEHFGHPICSLIIEW